MLDKLEAIKLRFDAVENELSQPETINDMKRFTTLNKEYKDLSKIVNEYYIFAKLLKDIDGNKEMLNTEKDSDMRELVKADLDDLIERRDILAEEIRVMLIPKDPEDSRDAILEIRGGAGGDEAAIFAGDLLRMYLRFFETKGWKASIVDETPGSSGGYKEAIVEVSGEDAYGILKYESGVHRVQRVPDTETQGRVHTSAASVAVLPQADEFDVDVKLSDIRKDTFCSSGPGGQSVNTTYSAVRLTHNPTGIVVQCQDQKSQMQNFDKALQVLRSRIYELEYNKRMEALSKKRKTMVSTGDRSAKVRTYNFPQSRVTDHRIGLTQHNLGQFMGGDIEGMIEALQLAENAERMQEGVVAL